jgi:hypothetical protein
MTLIFWLQKMISGIFYLVHFFSSYIPEPFIDRYGLGLFEYFKRINFQF